MSTLHSHTHWQAPQAETQAKACQRVCLSDPEKKKLKISFPSKNLKNANSQTDTKTFGQLVAKLNIDKGFKTQMTRTPACNSTYPKGGVSFSKDSFVGNQTLVFQIKFSGKNPALRVAAKRYV
ncbi:MAG TPA: hypothetical protein VFM99_09905 [Chitinophagales bacterium]|nr:hypothetical protein [Chitinophagales bacterium]